MEMRTEVEIKIQIEMTETLQMEMEMNATTRSTIRTFPGLSTQIGPRAMYARCHALGNLLLQGRDGFCLH
jgi:hypothetical protein